MSLLLSYLTLSHSKFKIDSENDNDLYKKGTIQEVSSDKENNDSAVSKIIKGNQDKTESTFLKKDLKSSHKESFADFMKVGLSVKHI